MTDQPPDDSYKPEWTPDDADEAFASRVMRGVLANQAQPAAPEDGTRQVRGLSVDEHVQGVLAGDRTVLARTITLIESNAAAHMAKAQAVLRELLPQTGQSIRVGVTGVPGAGKSTFIEALGKHLTASGHKVAVLAVDPTSSVSGGSILGDKTRMAELSRDPNAYIRPSPTGGMLGGVARKTRETMLVCEAAGFDVVLVETVGTGQSEIAVRAMVDFFLLLLITGAGDELQGIKKGVMEIADAVLINKADSDNKTAAQAARTETDRALHWVAPATAGWQTRAYTASSLTGEGVPEIWAVIEKFRAVTRESGVFEQRRRAQNREWMRTLVEEQLRLFFFNHPAVKAALPGIEQAVMDGTMPATAAAHRLLAIVTEAGGQ